MMHTIKLGIQIIKLATIKQNKTGTVSQIKATLRPALLIISLELVWYSTILLHALPKAVFFKC